MRNNFSEKFPKFGHVPSKTFAGPVTGPKILKNVGLQCHPPISLPQATQMSGADLHEIFTKICPHISILVKIVQKTNILYGMYPLL